MITLVHACSCALGDIYHVSQIITFRQLWPISKSAVKETLTTLLMSLWMEHLSIMKLQPSDVSHHTMPPQQVIPSTSSAPPSLYLSLSPQFWLTFGSANRHPLSFPPHSLLCHLLRSPFSNSSYLLRHFQTLVSSLPLASPSSSLFFHLPLLLGPFLLHVTTRSFSPTPLPPSYLWSLSSTFPTPAFSPFAAMTVPHGYTLKCTCARTILPRGVHMVVTRNPCRYSTRLWIGPAGMVITYDSKLV